MTILSIEQTLTLVKQSPCKTFAEYHKETIREFWHLLPFGKLKQTSSHALADLIGQSYDQTNIRIQLAISVLKHGHAINLTR